MLPPGTQPPLLQMSPRVHALPSSQASVLLANWHLLSLQVSVVQPLESSHSASLVQKPLQPTIGVKVQAPEPASQASVVQELPSSHVTGLATQPPPLQVSGPVQGLPSLHALASAFCAQPLGFFAALHASQVLPGLAMPAA